MALQHDYRPVANGLRTDHPIEGLPFVDDALLPLDDPDAIEAIGRGRGEGMWGRTDPCAQGWAAFTTDPRRTDLAWVVRWHPEHGRSVVLYLDEDASGAYTTYEEEALLFRSGGYWWDGATWYRPSQVFDASREVYVNRPAPGALTVTAADLLDSGSTDPSRGVVLDIADVDLDVGGRGARWRDDLALWARQHTGRHPAGCVVGLSAPELHAAHLLGVAELAETAGIAASTLRAYLARGESDVPVPQAVVGGRDMWSRPVAEDWAEQRRRSAEGIAEVIGDQEHPNLDRGVADLWQEFTRQFTSRLWDTTTWRKRFALRWRTKSAVEEIATDLAWNVAGGLRRIIPLSDLGHTVHDAVLYRFVYWQRITAKDPEEDFDAPGAFLPLGRQVAHMLDWLIRHHHSQAASTVAAIVGDAERDLKLPAALTGYSLRKAMGLDGKLDAETYNAFFDRALPPER
jgi:hypothetical protein